MAALEEFLASKTDEWSEQAARAKNPTPFARCPDGTYQLTLESVITDSDKNDDPIVLWKWIVSDESESHGEQVYDRRNLTFEDAFYWLGIDLIKFGYDPEDYTPSQLPEIFQQLTEAQPTIMGQLKTGRSGYQNLRIKSVVEEGDAGEASVPPSQTKPAAPKAAAPKPTPAPAAAPKGKPAAAPTPAAAATPAKGKPAAPPAKAAAPTPAAAAPAKPAPKPVPKPVAKPEPEPEPEVEDVQLVIGTNVEFVWEEETMQGTVTEINEDATDEASGGGNVGVQVGDLIYPVDFKDLVIVDPE